MKEKIKRLLSFLNRKKRDIFTFTVGLAFLGFCGFAVVQIGIWVYGWFVPSDIYTDNSYKNSLDGSSVYEAMYAEEGLEVASPEFFERYLANFIKQDIPYFDDPTQIDDEYIVSFGLWQAISLNGTQNIYTSDDKGNFKVPASDVEKFSQYCLDYASKLKHSDVDICGKFSYNSLSKVYTIPSAGVEFSLIPDVIKVEESDNDSFILTVDCYNDNQVSIEDPTNDPDNFVRRVRITVQDYGKKWSESGVEITQFKILSMQGVSEDEIAAEKDEADGADKENGTTEEDDIKLN